VGTVYRHFQSRQELVEAAAEQRFEQILAIAPWPAGSSLSRAWVWRNTCAMSLQSWPRTAECPPPSKRIAAPPAAHPAGKDLARIEEAIQVLIDDARTAGTVRPDLTPKDVYLILGGISAAISTDSGNWHGLLTLTLEGIRPR